MLGRTLLFATALSLALVAAPFGRFSATDTAEAAYSAFNPDDPDEAVYAVECTANFVVRCVEGTVAGDGCPL